ncbi:MAG: PAS domain S-box protein [Alphaproteobacteria bacterium]|nr:MAG: PAS domain S-box protein [Alphaproteobacteria bacterium]
MITETQLFEALPVAVYMTDAEGRITFYNRAAAELWGHNPELSSGQWCGSWRLYWPDGRPMPHNECPMATALKEGREVRGVEAIAERPDGTRLRFRTYPTLLRDASGRIVGAVNLLMDVTEQHDAHLESEWLAAIVVSSDDAIISKTLDGVITSWNGGAARIFGYEPSEMIGQSILRLIPPELHGEESEILARLQRGERIDHYETVRVAKDGRRVDVSLTVSPLRDRSGKVVGASKVGRDITERKRAEKLQRILTDELSHRVRNTLATVQAIASQSLARARSPNDFVASFGGRLQALANAHTLLTRSQMQGAEVMALVNEQVLVGAAMGDRISCSGPLVVLEPQTAMHLALVLHELATNARKYGALSVPDGRLSVTWEMRTNGGCSLHFAWKESDGPKVSAPRGHGFGRALIEQTVQSHGGHVSVHYHRDGLTCEIDLPLPAQPRALIDQDTAPVRSTAKPSLLSAADHRRTLEGKRVLVIEDEPLVSMDIESNLANAGCEIVGPAATLDRAKSLVESADYDAALVDVNLKGQPVDELATLLTKKNRPFAFVTGYGRDALPSGFRGAVVLGKPFSADQLLATTEVLLYQPSSVVQLRHKTSSSSA